MALIRSVVSRLVVTPTIKVLQPVAGSKRWASTSELGINFGLSDDQLAIRDLARKFTASEIIPVAAELDRTMEYPTEVRIWVPVCDYLVWLKRWFCDCSDHQESMGGGIGEYPYTRRGESLSELPLVSSNVVLRSMEVLTLACWIAPSFPRSWRTAALVYKPPLKPTAWQKLH